MAVTYPTDAQTQSWANLNSASQDNVDAFAAANGRMPASTLELNNWIANTDGLAVWPANTPQGDVNAYVEANLGPPPSQSAATTWFQQQGILDANGNFTGKNLPGGFFYDQATQQQAGGTSTAVAPVGGAPASLTPSTIVASVASSIQQHPVMWAGGALAVVGLIYLVKHR